MKAIKSNFKGKSTNLGITGLLILLVNFLSGGCSNEISPPPQLDSVDEAIHRSANCAVEFISFGIPAFH